MMVSRSREYLADASGAELTRNPLGLARALEKIDAAAAPTRLDQPGLGAPVHRRSARTARVNSKEGFWSDLFASHPPMAARIAALKAMAFQERPQVGTKRRGGTMAIDRKGTGLATDRPHLDRRVLALQGLGKLTLVRRPVDSARPASRLARMPSHPDRSAPRYLERIAIPGSALFARLVPLGEICFGDRADCSASGRRSSRSSRSSWC